jgi:threonine aldolase
MIDLRSDTVTRPTAAMREAMVRAEVGDDVLGDDPTVRALEEQGASRVGKEAGLYVPSGTMANQIALALHCRPGDEVLLGAEAHTMCFESGGGAAIAGVQFRVLGQGGLFGAADLDAAMHPPGNPHYPPARLVAVENTHNFAGGRVWPQDELRAIAARARAHGLALHLDGARLFNAEVASGVAAAELAAPFDTVSFCLSKGLGAPIGSLLCGPRELIRTRALRYRKMLGGGMRQAGIVAAAGLYALDHHVARLAEDHANARRLAEGLRGAPLLAASAPETNIVLIDLRDAAPFDAAGLCERAGAEGVLLVPIGARRVRAVTHLDVDRAGCERASAVLAGIARAA